MTPYLASLLSEVDVLEVLGDASATLVTGVTQDSRRVVPGALFCCLRGASFDGHAFAADAVRAGAGSLLAERRLELGVPLVRVADARVAVAPVAAAFHGHPSRALSVIGITGTNGKTTTAHLLGGICAAADRPCEVMGTLSGVRTTPEASDLQEELAKARSRGVGVVAMEVSSIALDEHRADAVWFAAALWTNLSQDHLDYHHSMEEYFGAKAHLFSPDRANVAVVNHDDPWGRRLVAQLDMPVVTFGLDGVTDLELGLAASRFRWRNQVVELQMGGVYNVVNALAAATVGVEVLGIDPATIAAGLSSVSGVPGRVEVIDAGQPFTVLVDYAHTPDGLEQVLRGARPAQGRLIVVFGCGGDRDRAKRPLMGSVAAALADLVVLTSDNPRREDPLEIIAEVANGIDDRAARGERGSLMIESDRSVAVALAINVAEPGDVVVIAGKGHETEQVIGTVTRHFDDREQARVALGARGYPDTA